MSASKIARESGLESLRELSKISGVPVTTLNDWEKTKPMTFSVLVIGAAAVKRDRESRKVGK
jgi:hypothetical protein